MGGGSGLLYEVKTNTEMIAPDAAVRTCG